MFINENPGYKKRVTRQLVYPKENNSGSTEAYLSLTFSLSVSFLILLKRENTSSTICS